MRAGAVWKKCGQFEYWFPICQLKNSSCKLIIFQQFVLIFALAPLGKTALKPCFSNLIFNLLPLQVST